MEHAPTLEDLRRLTLRGMAAYSAKTARRSTNALRAFIPDNVIERPLSIVEQLAIAPKIDRYGLPNICYAAAAVLQAVDAKAVITSIPLRIAAVRLNFVSLEAVVSGIHEAIEHLTHPNKGTQSLKRYTRGLQKADRIAERTIEYSDDPALAIKTIYEDYCELLRTTGEQKNMTLGSPIDPSYFTLS